MNIHRIKLLSEYGSFLKDNYLEQLAEENRQFLAKINLNLMKLSNEFSVEDLLKMSVTNLTKLLTAFEEGKVTEEIKEKILKLELEALPGVKQEYIESTDLLSIYTAQKQALVCFIPKFTSDPEIMKNLIEELEFTFLEVIDFTLQTFINQRIESATKLTESKVREETANFYNKELKESNEELKSQNENLEELQEELKISYEELRNQNENLGKLQEALLNRQEELVDKEIELTRSNDALVHFANIASHDLKEPLRMVKQYVQLIAKRYKGKLDNDADEFINFAIDGANRMEQLIQSLLDYAKLDKLGTPLEFTSSEAALEKAKINLITAIELSKAEISNDELPMVKINSVQLTQIFQNLISNAIKYHSKGTPVKIHIGVEKKNDSYLFSVNDNGIGIHPDYFNKIFQPFQRLHSNSEYEGIGLGLSFCKKIVEQYNGNMWVESSPDKGTTFFFNIIDY